VNARRLAANNPLGRDGVRHVAPRPRTERFGIVGAGVIGSGIARLLSGLGAQTVVIAPRRGGVERATDQISRWYASDVRHGRLSAAEAEAGLRNIYVTPRYADIAGAGFVIESVPEDVTVKQHVLAAVEAHTSPDCIFASNTSSIPLADIAANASRPHNIIGTHYFWPAHRYRLLEIARAASTSERTLQRTLDLARWQGKVPLLVRDVPGLFTTRILLVYLNEAVALVTEGAPVDVVDSAMRAFGWPMGPFQLLDAVGLEKFRGIHHSVSRHLGDRVMHVERLWPVVEAGHVGHQSGRQAETKGFYLHEGKPEVDARVYRLIGRKVGAGPTPFEISVRPIWQMVNEIGHCLAEAVVASADDADRGAVLGLGWPPARGAPLAYARWMGVRNIVRQLHAWARQYGPRFTPSLALFESLPTSPQEATRMTNARLSLPK
jgi:3-hydroxyacyl-CoA dehydrogenase / enoyl-CoA hydratase / 3-hydroxybutyryl-CoA epimerase